MDDKKLPLHKGVYILPNLMTTGSLCSAFIGLIMAIQGNYEWSAVAILFSCVLDGLDGKVARLTHTASEFGVQYDSLADVIAFGVTPAVLIYQWSLHEFGRLGLMASFLFMTCGALRLARFNVQSSKATSKKYFVGLPIPAAGCTLATLIYFAEYLPEGMARRLPLAALILVYMLSFLMVSRVRYAAFKDYDWFKAHPFSSMVTAILLFALLASEPKLLGFPLLLGYVIFGLLHTFLVLAKRENGVLESNEDELRPTA